MSRLFSNIIFGIRQNIKYALFELLYMHIYTLYIHINFVTNMEWELLFKLRL